MFAALVVAVGERALVRRPSANDEEGRPSANDEEGRPLASDKKEERGSAR
jgi:hypothetical protein